MFRVNAHSMNNSMSKYNHAYLFSEAKDIKPINKRFMRIHVTLDLDYLYDVVEQKIVAACRKIHVDELKEACVLNNVYSSGLSILYKVYDNELKFVTTNEKVKDYEVVSPIGEKVLEVRPRNSDSIDTLVAVIDEHDNLNIVCRKICDDELCTYSLSRDYLAVIDNFTLFIINIHDGCISKMDLKKHIEEHVSIDNVEAIELAKCNIGVGYTLFTVQPKGKKPQKVFCIDKDNNISYLFDKRFVVFVYEGARSFVMSLKIRRDIYEFFRVDELPKRKRLKEVKVFGEWFYTLDYDNIAYIISDSYEHIIGPLQHKPVFIYSCTSEPEFQFIFINDVLYAVSKDSVTPIEIDDKVMDVLKSNRGLHLTHNNETIYLLEQICVNMRYKKAFALPEYYKQVTIHENNLICYAPHVIGIYENIADVSTLNEAKVLEYNIESSLDSIPPTFVP